MMIPQPHDPLTEADKLTFGETQRHPITALPLEIGSGALPPNQQALIQCDYIEATQGAAAADAMRKKLTDATRYVADAAALASDGISPAIAKATAALR